MQQSITINIIEPGSGNLPLGPGSENLPQLGYLAGFFSSPQAQLLFMILAILVVVASAILYCSYKRVITGGAFAELKRKALPTLIAFALVPFAQLALAPANLTSYAAVNAAFPNQTVNIEQGATFDTLTFAANVDDTTYADGYDVTASLSASSVLPAGVSLTNQGQDIADAASGVKVREYRSDAGVDDGLIEYAITVPSDAPIIGAFAVLVLNYKVDDFINDLTNYFTITNATAVTPKWTTSGLPLEYSADGAPWQDATSGTAITGITGAIKFRGVGRDTLYTSASSANNAWIITGNNVALSGNLNTVLDYNNPPLTLGTGAFQYMFYNSGTISDITGLTLPATTLANFCYYDMFRGNQITSLAGFELPAMTLANYCYYDMFRDNQITSLSGFELPAMTLAEKCYASMFMGNQITSLAGFELPTMTLADSCYDSMFRTNQITSLAGFELPATTLAERCYATMFMDNQITSVAGFSLPATALTYYCYDGMFYNDPVELYTATGANHNTPFRIPTAGTGTMGDNSMRNMFNTRVGNAPTAPVINTTYYTSP